MKSHIIQLDIHDNVLSITDKLSWGKTKRILLVYPASGRLELTRLDLTLIQRAAKKSGLWIGMVSFPKDQKKLASELEIPFFRSIDHAQRAKWIKKGGVTRIIRPGAYPGLRRLILENREKTTDWQLKTGVRTIFFSLGVLPVLLIALLFIPSAEIHLNLIPKEHTLSLQLHTDDNVKNVGFSGSIPSQKITIEVEGSKRTEISSKVEVPASKATGVVRFTNSTDIVVSIPAGTIVTQLTDPGNRFITTNPGEVPPGEGGFLDLPVQALALGKIGNLEANSIQSVIGDLGVKLTVSNPEPTTGGTDVLSNMPTELDRTNLYNLLESELRDQALRDGRSILAVGDILFSNAIKLETTTNEVFVPAPGQAGDQLLLKLKLTYSIPYVAYSDVKKLALPALRSNLPTGFHALDDSITMDLITPPNENNPGPTDLEIKVTQKIVRDIDPNFISRLVKGLSTKDAIKILKDKFNNEMSPTIKIRPSWWPYLPFIPLRIVIYN